VNKNGKRQRMSDQVKKNKFVKFHVPPSFFTFALLRILCSIDNQEKLKRARVSYNNGSFLICKNIFY